MNVDLQSARTGGVLKVYRRHIPTEANQGNEAKTIVNLVCTGAVFLAAKRPSRQQKELNHRDPEFTEAESGKAIFCFSELPVPPW